MNIVTGYKGEPHVTAQQLRNAFRGIFGSGSSILNVGSKLAASVVSANEISIADGVFCLQGCIGEIPVGTSESLTIDNGSQGMQRIDLIVVRYTRNGSTGVENMALAVIKGTPASSSPAIPSYTNGSIVNGDALVEVPLYSVNINGLTISSVTAMTGVKYSLATLGTGTLATTAQTIIEAINELVGKIGNTTMGTSATTLTGAIKEVNDRLIGSFQLFGRLLYRAGSSSIIPAFVFETKTADNIMIQANSTATVDLSLAKTNYTPFAVHGVRINNASSSGANSSYCFPYSWYFNPSTGACSVGIRNTGDLAVASVKVVIEVTYIASGVL